MWELLGGAGERPGKDLTEPNIEWFDDIVDQAIEEAKQLEEARLKGHRVINLSDLL